MGTAMTRHGHIAWRVIAAVAFAGTAALAVMLTRAPAQDHATLSDDSGLSACAAFSLEARQAAGSTVYTLEFTNISAHSCDLYGYPDVSAYVGGQAAGAQLGTAAAHDTSVRPRPVVLAPGDTAHSVLRVNRVGGLRREACGQVTAREIRVALPPRGRPAFASVRFPACSRKGPTFMSVQPIQARAGVPG
jgi:hypothetical protein